MTKEQSATLLLLALATLSACATTDSVDRQPKINPSDIRSLLGCSPDEIAVCVDVDCQVSDYVCTPKVDFRRVFEPRPHY